MSKKILDCFKIEPTFSPDQDLNFQHPGTSGNVKNEQERNFDINLDEIKPEIRECRVILQDINKKVQIKNNSASESPKQDKNGLKLYCKICNKSYLKSSGLKKHINLKHSQSSSLKLFICDFDGKTFKLKNLLNSHLKKHQLKIKCELCMAEIQPIYMKTHIQNVHTEQNVQCPVCQIQLKSLRSLQSHIKRHNKTIECELCHKFFGTKTDLKYHKKNFHKNPEFYCKICGKQFKIKGNFEMHQKVHDKNRLKLFKCQLCDHSTDFKQNLLNHLKYHKVKDQRQAAIKNPEKCNICQKLLKTKHALSHHMFSVHPVTPFQCDICGKYTKTKHNLLRHILTHLKNKNLKNYSHFNRIQVFGYGLARE